MPRRFSSVPAPALIAAVLSTLVLVGCAGPVPVGAPTADATPSQTPEATPTPTPTPEPVAEAALITVAATGVTVTDAEGAVMLTIAYSSDPETVISAVTEALGETPTAVTWPGAVCSAETTITSWGGLHLSDPAGYAGGPGALFTVSVDGPSTAGAVPIVASAGFSVGDAIPTVATLTGVSAVDYGDWVTVSSDLQGPSFDDPNAWGVSGYGRGGAIEQFSAPIYYYYDC